MKITAILTGWKRPQNLERQLEAIKNQTIAPTDIMMWYNGENAEHAQKALPGVKTASCNHNFKFIGRFAYALLARTEYVCIFDDDTIPGPKWFENCINTMKTHEGILGTTGIYLTKNTNYRDHRKIGWNGQKSNEPIEVDLVGHAWFFKYDWLKYFWMEAPLSWDNAEDIHFSYAAQKYGGIKTYVPPHPDTDRSIWGSLNGSALGNDSVSSWVNRDKNNHTIIRDNCVEKAVQNGWKLVHSK
jgi:GT2 family glycosyltransferase